MKQPTIEVSKAVLAAHPERIRVEQTRLLYASFASGTASSGLGALALAGGLALESRVSVATASVWSAAMALCVGIHFGLRHVYFRSPHANVRWRAWHRAFLAIVLAEGLVWGVGAVSMTSYTDLDQELLIAAMSIVMASGAVSVFQASWPVYLAFLFPTMAPHLIVMWLGSYPLHDMLTVLVAMYLLAMPLVGRNANRNLLDNIRLRFENDDISQDLRRQKAVAEQANQAKSRFLAAASHDLRQPVHALGLFVGALSARSLDPEARSLVDRIAISAAAMDKLFIALIDISKLDAGVVQPVPEPVQLGALFDRLGDEFASAARIKGIELRAVACSATVRADAAMLERVVRNLLGNAVRYTEQGRILLGARRGKDFVTVEVWDTGIGIDSRLHELIFQEFFQVGNVERDREQGLGLGLAIVRRTADLMGVTLSMHSQPGRGSVFRLTLPLSADHPRRPTAAPIPRTTEAPGLVFVIDDELAIRDATANLLRSWGHDVICGASGLDILDQAAVCPRRPDVIMCDFRLRGGESGIDVIAHLRREYNEDVPAFLVTGDTAVERIEAAVASGLAIMYKPVSADALRLAVDRALELRVIEVAGP